MKQISLLLLLLASVFVAAAQTPETRPSTPAKTTAPSKTARAADAEQQLKVRRSQARSLLISLSTDARSFQDQTLRARSLAHIADALWQVDAEQGRLLFRKAWEAAEFADQENDRKLQEEIRQQRAKTGGGYAINLPPNLRREVLRLAVKRDRVLGEEFLEKLKVQKVEEATSATRRPGRLDEAMTQRLSVARELLQAGEVDRALQFADPALSVIGAESINFLSDLRAKDPAAADRRYAALLASATTNPQADANTVSMLSSYIFTPYLTVFFTKGGMSSSQSASKIVPAEVSPELRNAFFQAAGSILLRPLPGPGQDQGTAGVDGKYLVIRRLLPFFEQSAPPELVESLRAHLNALNGIVSDETRRREDDAINRGLRPEQASISREQSALDRLDHAKTSAERDGIYIELAMIASGRGDLKSREFAGKIEDSETRKGVGAYVDASLAIHSVKKKLTDQALDLVQKGDLTHLHKVWVLTETAKILAPTDKDKALELVDSAVDEARRIEVSDPGLPRGLFAVANALKVIDAPRVWDAAFDAVKAANSAEGFTGEDGEIVLKFQSGGHSSVYTNDIAEFDLDGIFRDLAEKDYERAVELARGFQAEGPRAVATIAIARAILEPKKKAPAAARN